MAGDIVLTSELAWPASSSHYRWVVDFLLEQVERPGAAAALREADDHGLGIVDLAELPTDDRDEIYQVLRDRLVPSASQQIAGDAPYRDAYLTSFAQLRDLASTALAEYGGRAIADHAIVLAPQVQWRTHRAMYLWVLSFLAERCQEPEVSGLLTGVRDNGATELDLTGLPSVEQTALLGSLADELVDAAAARLPETTAGREHQLGKLSELAALAGSARADRS